MSVTRRNNMRRPHGSGRINSSGNAWAAAAGAHGICSTSRTPSPRRDLSASIAPGSSMRHQLGAPAGDWAVAAAVHSARPAARTATRARCNSCPIMAQSFTGLLA